MCEPSEGSMRRGYNRNKTKYSAEEDFPDLTNNKGAIAEILTKEMYANYRDVVTVTGFTFDEVIQAALDFPCNNCPCGDKCVCGVFAGDEDCFEKYKDFLDGVIRKVRGGFQEGQAQKNDFDLNKLIGGQLDTEYVESCHLEAGRNIRGFGLSPRICRTDRRKLEMVLGDILQSMTGDYQGCYHSLSNMTPCEKAKLVEEKIMCCEKPCHPAMQRCGLLRDWPDGRGIWHNNKKTFMAYVNHDADHVKLTSMASGGDMKDVFKKFSDGLVMFENLVKSHNHMIMHNDQLGYISANPAHIGTVLTVSVTMKLPHLGELDVLDAILKKLNLSKKVACSESGTFCISNIDRMGYSENQILQIVTEGIKLLIEMDKAKANGQDINEMVPP